MASGSLEAGHDRDRHSHYSPPEAADTMAIATSCSRTATHSFCRGPPFSLAYIYLLLIDFIGSPQALMRSKASFQPMCNSTNRFYLLFSCFSSTPRSSKHFSLSFWKRCPDPNPLGFPSHSMGLHSSDHNPF